MRDFEKLGMFYLGRNYDLEEGQVLDEPVLYEAKDLTTHGVCVGMTGSGKTGLCISLLEEAAIDGIPSIIIDPKGDMGNLMLTFPDLEPASFLPWVDNDEAARKGITPKQHAARVAELWRNGLGKWDQNPERLARLKAAADVSIYTPGSTAGLPISVLGSFAAPPPELVADPAALGDRIEGAVSGLLSLVGIDADPVRSREHILLANILNRAWQAGRSLDLAGLIGEIQNPPFDRVGVLDLEAFYPPKNRFELAITLNNLLASPGFAAWLEGEHLDIASLLYAPDGRPRVSIMSIAHLSDAERMFFVSILLNEIVAWMRAQPGTSSLRAILYMDEIFGYFPPTAKPPSKKPMLTLLKQARAYGLGVLLATQNPVDLDYKGLSNTGTWFIGRLQTERDKMRVLDGLEGASVAAGSAFNRAKLDDVLSAMGKRVFLMHNVHEDAPVIFHTRWAMSYLRGPLTTAQIASLMAPLKQTAAPVTPATIETATTTPTTTPSPTMPAPEPAATSDRPKVHPDVQQLFLPITKTRSPEHQVVYRPALAGVTDLHYASAKIKLDLWRSLALLTDLPGADMPADWGGGRIITDRELDLRPRPDAEAAEYSPLPPKAGNKGSYERWQRDLKTWLYQEQKLMLFRCRSLKALSSPGEDEGTFRGRLAHMAREQRDLKVSKLREKYGGKLNRIRDRIRRAEDRVQTEEDQYKQQRLNTGISVASSLVGALFGRKLLSVANVGRGTSAVRAAAKSGREKQDIERARKELATQQQALADLERKLADEITDVELDCNPASLDVEEHPVKPRKNDIAVEVFGLVWIPWSIRPDGTATALTQL